MNIEKILELKDETLNRIEESLKVIDILECAEDDFIDYGSIVNSKVERLINELKSDVREIIQRTDKYELVLAMYLQNQSYWWVNEMQELCNISSSSVLFEAYELYKECFFERPKLTRFEDINDVRENVFRLYKENRNVDMYKVEEYSKLLALICEYINSEES